MIITKEELVKQHGLRKQIEREGYENTLNEFKELHIPDIIHYIQVAINSGEYVINVHPNPYYGFDPTYKFIIKKYLNNIESDKVKRLLRYFTPNTIFHKAVNHFDQHYNVEMDYDVSINQLSLTLVPKE